MECCFSGPGWTLLYYSWNKAYNISSLGCNGVSITVTAGFSFWWLVLPFRERNYFKWLSFRNIKYIFLYKKRVQSIYTVLTSHAVDQHFHKIYSLSYLQNCTETLNFLPVLRREQNDRLFPWVTFIHLLNYSAHQKAVNLTCPISLLI